MDCAPAYGLAPHLKSAWHRRKRCSLRGPNCRGETQATHRVYDTCKKWVIAWINPNVCRISASAGENGTWGLCFRRAQESFEGIGKGVFRIVGYWGSTFGQ